MKKLTPPAPFYSAPVEEKWEFFWYWVRQTIESEVWGDPLLNFMFKEGKVYGIISDLSFDEFSFLAGEIKTGRYRGRGRRPGQWFYTHGVEFRERMSYSKKSHHKKKELNEKELSRKEWRDQKQFLRDKAKSNMWGSRKRWAKKWSNKYHRQHVRQCLSQCRYDDLTALLEKIFKDSWMYD